MRRSILALTLIALVFLMFGRRVEAESATTGDPTGDVFDQHAQTSGPGMLDIVSVTHVDDGVRATYTLTTKGGYNTANVHAAHLYLDGLEGVESYDCAHAVLAIETGTRTGIVRQCLGSGGGMEGGPGGFRDLGTATVDHAEGSNTLTVSFDLDVLRNAGFTGSSFRYTIWLAETESVSDSIPNGNTITHQLSLPATPVPTAVPVPTVAPTPDPTPVETPTVTVTTSSAPTRAPQAASFGAPEEKDEKSGFPVIPVAAGGGVVLAGVAFALVRFLPFL